MKLKGIELIGTYKVIFKGLRSEVYDEKGNLFYAEDFDGFWFKREFDERGNKIYTEFSSGQWNRTKYDENGNKIYFEDSDGLWIKWEYDENGNEIYFEDSDGNIIDNRVKELTVEEVEKLLGYKIKIKGENK